MARQYATKAELLAAIQAIEDLGLPVDPDFYRQLEKFESGETQQILQSSTSKPNSKNPIYETLRQNYKFPPYIMPKEVCDCIETTVDKLLEDVPNADDPGLLLGKIQCGKTATFEGIIGYSFDRGIDVCIVLTKGTNMLSEQTKQRFEKDYAYFKNNEIATINIYDIMELKKKKLMEWRVNSSKTLIICKKQAKNMEHLENLFVSHCPFLKNKKVLVVDDEADFASRNYLTAELNSKKNQDGQLVQQDADLKMAAISKQIDDFRSIPTYCRYLQVTATPYSLFLQPKGDLYLQGNKVLSFRPRFVSLVPIHNQYIGGQQYFIDSQDPESMYSHLYVQVQQKCIDVLGHEDKRYINNPLSSQNIFDLTYALISYLMATAIRVLQNEELGKKNYHSSALIHVEIDKNNHRWQQKLIDATLKRIQKVFVSNDHDKRIDLAMEIVWKDFQESTRKGLEAKDAEENPKPLLTQNLPNKDDVIRVVKDIFVDNKINIQVVNSDEDVKSLLNEDGELDLEDGVANIFIGGNILDRGITIKKLLCFFYGRDPKNFQQDTVIQHARMYGARDLADMAVTRLHTTEKIHQILVRMNELDDQLRKWFLDGRDLEEPNAVFVGYDKNIKPCASSKIKASNAIVIKKHKFFVPSGFWTGSNTKIKDIVSEIEDLIKSAPGYRQKDANGFFIIEKTRVFDIIHLIQRTFVYEDKFFNMDHKNDILEMLCAIQKCAGDELYCLHRTNRNMSRLRDNGGFIDAPLDGRTDSAPAKAIGVDMPVIFFIGQNGSKDKREDGINYGWNDAPFYWPVFMTAENTDNVMFAIDSSRAKKRYIYDEEEILQDIDPSLVLKVVTNNPDQYSTNGEFERSIKERTAGYYLQRDFLGNWEIADGVEIPEDDYQGLYTRNEDKFPFVLRPYKYILVRSGKNNKLVLTLFELKNPDEWEVFNDIELNEEGDLLDRDKLTKDIEEILVHRKDILMSSDLSEKEYFNDKVCQWVVKYKIGNLVRTKEYEITDEEMQDLTQDEIS